MDAIVKFPISASCHGTNSNITKRLALGYPSIKRPCNLHYSDKLKEQHRGMCFRRNHVLHNKSWDNKYRISAIASKGESNNRKDSFSPADTVYQFYKCINEKKLEQLGECISQDACFDDYAFTKPFQGKEEVMQFLKQLTASMGQNVKFRVRQICQGDDFTAAASWHLEWKQEQIPFTRGCSFFKLSKGGENMTIRRAEVLIESPIKPGGIVLNLLKTVTSLFDDFPRAAGWFLRSPHVILKWTLKIYNIFVAPIVNPLLDGYIQLWSFVARLIGVAFNFVIFISKIFIK